MLRNTRGGRRRGKIECDVMGGLKWSETVRGIGSAMTKNESRAEARRSGRGDTGQAAEGKSPRPTHPTDSEF